MRTTAQTTVIRRVLSGAAGLALVASGLLALAPAASADVTYVPEKWNGKVVYLSQSCHDRGDTVCHDNRGCLGFSENTNSRLVAMSAVRATGTSHPNLLERGYKVVRGNGLTRQNIDSSNRVGADVHVPLHSNAIDKGCESGLPADRYGTHVLYVSKAGRQCAERLVSSVGASSPGTNDTRQYRTDLGELNQTNAVACYLEQDFHVWDRGVRWMWARDAWSWRIAAGIDAYLGYP
ncbi:hypothetical protein ACFQHV_20045 [Promicromonospora thailandica]|uniref:N-acetylmuramoyl-L-alanine amidase n=1 Tax=Promicromonospora thailandica TaxID=765201 RepID=A0A9X2G2E5_9MICO|nr:hypothetical protein [Promicromonospora thailandica]MCP2264208.1 N-acetylmuramoyl-L-alanine amidase [Promicromonospora thailandica]BFF21122.1 hypothetical protein GCM10025730_46430 [Promicromonospora thailandica]